MKNPQIYFDVIRLHGHDARLHRKILDHLPAKPQRNRFLDYRNKIRMQRQDVKRPLVVVGRQRINLPLVQNAAAITDDDCEFFFNFRRGLEYHTMQSSRSYFLISFALPMYRNLSSGIESYFPSRIAFTSSSVVLRGTNCPSRFAYKRHDSLQGLRPLKQNSDLSRGFIMEFPGGTGI